MYFLEESWLLVLCSPASGPHLLILNTMSPHSSSWRFLQLPQLHRFMRYSLPSQYECSSTEPSQFLVDPAQRHVAVLALPGSALVIPVDLLTRDVFSLGARPHVIWEEWGKDAIRLCLRSDVSTLQFVGTKMLALYGSPSYPINWGIEMYDLSKLGQKDIQMNQDGVCRRVLSVPKWFARCQIEDADGTPKNTYLVGNKLVCFYVSLATFSNLSCKFKPHCTEPAVGVRRRLLPTRVENWLISDPGKLPSRWAPYAVGFDSRMCEIG